MIKYLDIKKITGLHAAEIHEAVRRVTDSGWYLQGEANAAFENNYARYIGTEHCIGCSNGLAALTLILRAYMELGVMKRGDEVIVPANTYIASMLAVTSNGLKIVPVEPRPDTFQIDDSLIESAITCRTRAVMIVHLYGKCACTGRIKDICRRHGLKLIEDNAQAHGATDVMGRRTGSLGDAAGHSFYPGKNLGALGDAGAVTTDDNELATMVRTLANYGSSVKYVFPYEGMNSRMDELQAAVLDVKLRHLDEDNERRRRVAAYYINNVRSEAVDIPGQEYLQNNVFHIFPVMCESRDRLQKHLADNGIQTVIHYPIPPHRQECYRHLGIKDLPVTEKIHREELSIPCNQILTQDETDRIIEVINDYK